MLRERLAADLICAMKSGDKQAIPIIRGLIAELHNEHVKHGIGAVLDDATETHIVTRECNRYQEALDFAHQSGRQDLIAQAAFAIGYIKSYLPQQLSEDEVKEMIDTFLKSIEAPTTKHFGALMKHLTPQVRGRFDMKQVSELAQDALRENNS